MAEEQAELPTEDHRMEEEKDTSEKEDESEEEESDDEEYFEVEKIMSRKKRDGVFLYRVRWKGYPPSNDTWEPVDNLDVVQDMVEEFDAKEEQKSRARQEERRLRKLRMEGKKLPGEESSDSSDSSEGEHLLNEDTKFYKMLEKNKDIVFGQPDLYSKVKSRAATLASKKKQEESKKEASSKPAQKTEERRGRGRGRPKEESPQEKSKNGSRHSKKAASKDCEDESDDSPVRARTTGRGRGKPRKKVVSDEEDSEDSTSTGRGRGRGRPKKKKHSSEDDDDSDSASVAKGRGRGRSEKKQQTSEDDDDADSVDSDSARKGRGRGRPGKKAVIEDSEGNESDSDDHVPLRVLGKQKKKFRIESSEENGSDSSLILKKQSKPAPSTDRKTARRPAPTKKTATQRKHSPISEEDSEKSSSGSEAEVKETSLGSDKAPVTIEISDRTSPKTTKPDQATETKVETDSTKPASNINTSPKPSCVKPSRLIVPVLEKLALASQLEMGKGAVEGSLREGQSMTSPSRSRAAQEEKKAAQEKETLAKTESMETEAVHKKDDSKESKKKSSSSRKRKQDTAAEHARAVTEGEASPVKTSPPPTHHSPAAEDSQPASMDCDPPVLSKEPRASEVGSNEDFTVSASPPLLQRSGGEKKVPPLRITVPKLKIEAPKLKAESPKPYHHSPKPQQSVSGKSEKVKLKDGVKSGKHDHHTPGSALKVPHVSKQPACRESMPDSAPAVAVSSAAAVTVATSCAATKRDSTSKAGSGSGASHHQSKPDLSLKFGRTLAVESAAMKLEGLSSRMPKSESVDRSVRADNLPDPKTGRTDGLDARRRYSTNSDLSVTVSREPLSGPYTPSLAKDLPSPGRDSLLTPSSRTGSAVFSMAGTSRESSSLYSRDSSLLGRGVGGLTSPSSRDLATHTSTSFKDSHFSSSSSASTRDAHLTSGSSRDFGSGAGSPGDVRLGAGYIHLSSGSSRESSFPSAGNSGHPKDSCAGGSRHSLTVSSLISGKENADRPLGFKSVLSSVVPKKGDSVQPLDTILNSSLYDADKSRQYKGLDSDFDLALQRIDLEYLEKLLLPPVTPMELSDEELRQAVIDGNCYLVERALACSKPYNLDLPDNKGYTLLMNAVLRGSDDIIVHLLSRGADAQVQVNGVTALMLAVEHAESSTVFMLLEMGAHVNAADLSGETALFKAVRRGDKQILKLLLDHGANFSLVSRLGLSPLQMAKQFRLADVETTLIDHIHKVVRSFEEQVNLTVRGTAKLVSCLFPHHCVPLYESDTITVPFKYHPAMPSGPGMGCLLFIAHARFNPGDVKCRLYGQCAVERVTLNGVLQPCLTEESNFVLMCHPLITGWNELVIHTKKDPMSKAKLIVCAYKAQLIYK